MHPGQYTVINSPKKDIVIKSKKELEANVWILENLNLDTTAKVQIHVGGIYGNKKEALNRFIKNFYLLPETVRKRLVIENDDRLFDFKDCLYLSEELNLPTVFDVFHHSIKNNNEDVLESMQLLQDYWGINDGVPMVDWSHQEPDSRIGKHANSINLELFKSFINEIRAIDFDLMFEIRDKEKSALKAVNWLRTIGRI
jgi:UV DNA damage endonuclease